MTAKGFDTDQSFMLIEIDGDSLHFQTISRRGRLVDSGTITRQTQPEALFDSVAAPVSRRRRHSAGRHRRWQC